MPTPEPYVSWSKMTEAKGAARIAAMAEQAERSPSWRHRMASQGAGVYSSLGYGDLFEGMYSDLWTGPKTRSRSKRPPSKLKLNFAKAIVRTLRSKITGLDEPKSQMVGTDCTWEEHRQGVWADRFIEGTQHLPQGTYQNAWDLARHGFLVSGAATGTVGARVEPDFVTKRVRAMLRSTMCTFIDPSDWADGRPLTTIDVTWENPEYLAEDPRWKKHAAHIMASAKPAPHMALRDDVDFRTPMVKVVSAWRMPFGSFKGRNARVVAGKAILWDDWAFNEPPIAFFRMQRTLGDTFWSENFIEDCYDALFTANDILRSVDEAIRKLSQTYVVRDIRGITSKAAALNAKDVNFLDYDGAKTNIPLSVIQPPPINDSYWNVFRELVSGLHEILGVDQMHTAGQRPEGINSGKGVRLVASLFSERFSEIQRNWRQWVAVDTAQLYLRAARQVGEHDPDWQVNWPGQDFEAKVPVKALDIDDKLYTMRPYVVSEQKNTPADRAATAEEMYNRGEITEEQLQVILGGLLDTPAETKGSTVQRRWVAKNLSLILDSEESVVEDEAAFMGETYMQPMPWLDPVSMKAQALIAYVQADIDGLPQNRRRLLRRFLEDIDMLEQQLATQASKQSALENANIKIETGMDAFGGAPAPEGMAVDGGEQPGAGAVPGGDALAGLGGAPAVGMA